MRTAIFNWLLFIFLITGCTKSELSPADYIKYFEENGMPESHTQIGNIKVEMKFIPAEYMLLKDDKAKNISQKTIDEKNDLVYLHLDFFDLESKSEAIRSTANNEMELYQKIEYASFKAQEDLSMIRGKDTVSCVLYHFERGYNLSSNNRMILGFPNKGEGNESITLRYEDKLFGIGIINLVIDKEKLNRVPKLKI